MSMAASEMTGTNTGKHLGICQEKQNSSSMGMILEKKPCNFLFNPCVQTQTKTSEVTRQYICHQQDDDEKSC